MLQKTTECLLKRTRQEAIVEMGLGGCDFMKHKVLIFVASGALVVSAPVAGASTLSLNMDDLTTPTGTVGYSNTFTYSNSGGAWDVKATNTYVSSPPEGYIPGTVGDFDVELTTMGSLINYGDGTVVLEMHLNVTNRRGTGPQQFRAVLNASGLGPAGYYAVRSGIGGHDSTGSSATHVFTDTVVGNAYTFATQNGPTYDVSNTRGAVGPAGELTLEHTVVSSAIGIDQTITYDTVTEITALATGTAGDAYLGAIHRGDTFASKNIDITAATGNTQQLSISSSSGTNTAYSTGTVSGLNAGGTVGNAVSVNIANTASRSEGEVSETVNIGFTSSGSAGTYTTNTDASIVTGMIYSGQSTWMRTTGGTWGGDTQDRLNTHDGTVANPLWSTNDGAPGIWGPSFDNVDTATFSNALTTPTATINVISPVSVKSITFNNTENESYTIAQSTGGSLQLKSYTGIANLDDLAGNHQITAPITMQSNVSSTVNSGSILTVTQLLTGTGGTQTLTKTGGGTLLLTGEGASSSNAAATTVYQGTLRVDGTLNAPTLVTKDSGGAGTLSGITGTIGGPVTVANGGTISPGDGEAVRSSTLTVSSLLLQSGGNYHFDISTIVGSGYQGGEGTNYDTILAGNTSVLDLTGITTSGGLFNLQVDYPFNSPNNGGFDYTKDYHWELGTFTSMVSNTSDINSLFNINLGSFKPYWQGWWSVSYGNQGDQVLYLNYVYNSVPEAGTAMLGLIALMPILSHRVRRRMPALAAAE